MVGPSPNDPVAELLGLLERRRPLLTSRPEFLARQLAAGGLTYAERLLRALRAAVAADVGDAAGGLIRTIWECWCIGQYLLLKGDEAAAHLADYYQYRLRQLANDWPVDDDEEHPFEALINREAPKTELNLRQIAIEVSRLIDERDGTARVKPTGSGGYDMLHRFESTWSTHAGFGAFARYVVPIPEPRHAQGLREYVYESASEQERVDVNIARARRTEPRDGGLPSPGCGSGFWRAPSTRRLASA